VNIERFNELLNGPLGHQLMPFAIMRLSQALLFVVQQTGEAGEKALEEWCQLREADDNAGDDDLADDGSADGEVDEDLDEMLDLHAEEKAGHEREMGGES
jgi:hypothetical protein